MGLNFKGKQMCWSSSELRWSYTAGRKGTHGKYSPCSLARAASSLAMVKRREWVSWQITSSCHKWLAEGRHSVRFPRSQPVKKTLPPLFRMDFIWLLIQKHCSKWKRNLVVGWENCLVRVRHVKRRRVLVGEPQRNRLQDYYGVLLLWWLTELWKLAWPHHDFTHFLNYFPLDCYKIELLSLHFWDIAVGANAATLWQH